MKKPEEPKESRHGKLAEVTAQTSITMNKTLLAKAKAEAKKEGRSLSNWLEQLVKKSLPPLSITVVAYHAIRSGSDWSAAACLGTLQAVGTYLLGLAA